MELRLGFLSSHNGTLVRAIVNEIKSGELEAQAKVVISNNLNSQVLEFSRASKIPNYCINSKNSVNPEEAILEKLKEHEVNLLLCAGYMKKVEDIIIKAYNNRILNIHRALLPKYGGEGMWGRAVHEAVIASNDSETGATVHIVNSNYDSGRIIAQYKVPRYKNDTPETLEKRVLKIECVIYSQVLRDIQQGLIDLDED
ncbi:phosphoribosylglycinamide formyltransferase [Candidatus Pacearchaeota archaeon]|nr:phosphoribosylglycinamide formyltransferase [Candidatus Pacearchaeota archaeon]